MPDDLTQCETNLRKLAERLHKGWARLHPVTEKNLALVRQAVHEQWRKEQELRKTDGGVKEQTHDKGKSPSTPGLETEEEVSQEKRRRRRSPEKDRGR
jgi:hypothetical protein